MSTKSTPPKTKAPRRREILDLLRKHDRPLSDRALFQAFALRKGPGRDAFLDRLRRMQRDGLVFVDRKGRFGLPDRMDAIRGRINGHPKGFGFLTPENGGSDLYVPPSEMRKVLHGDRVLARVAKVDRRGRQEVSVLEVLERSNLSVVGRFIVEQGLAFVVPSDLRLAQDIFIPPGDCREAKSGDVVVAEIRRQPSTRTQPVGAVVEVIGDELAPGMEIEIAIRKHGLPNQWSEQILAATVGLQEAIEATDRESRWDIRELPLITIDGEDARDFDDAVFCERNEGAWRLIVAIADVSYFVQPDDPIDVEAGKRGNSVYFPGQVVPMLPEKLSNELCSLKPGVDRLCFACEMTFSRAGDISHFAFKPAIMRSKARLTYTEAGAILDGEHDNDGAGPDVLNSLRLLGELADILRTRRKRHGTVDFDLPESRIVFNDERKILRIESVARNDAHLLIEECMLAANVCAARLLGSSGGLGVFRVHEKPDPGKIEDVRAFLGEFGLSLGGGKEPTAKDYLTVVQQVRDRPNARIVQMALLRSMKQAVYSREDNGHFALGFTTYTHFTSPIRRYPDLLVHRALKEAVSLSIAEYDEIDTLKMSEIAEHCSMTERRADEATREVEQWLKAEYMLDHIGDRFHGSVTSVTDFGIFVEIDDLLVEGLVHVTALDGDYYHFDPVGRRLVGERTGRRYELGTRLQVRVVRVDLTQARIELELVTKSSAKTKRRRRAGKRG